jgi:hypothetical protein
MVIIKEGEMNGERIIDIMFGVALATIIAFFMWLLLFVIFPPTAHFENKISTTRTIPATEWKCKINAETKEIICKGVMK